ncbi:MAG: hypothetical protein K1X75_07920 [Leptospirales bacterium]|nr:hypothetical protein [Leptospirales bacterium]
MHIQWRILGKERRRGDVLLQARYGFRVEGRLAELEYNRSSAGPIFAALFQDNDPLRFLYAAGDPPQLQARRGKDVVAALEWRLQSPDFRIMLAPPRSMALSFYRYAIGQSEVAISELDRALPVGLMDRQRMMFEFDAQLDMPRALLLTAVILVLENEWVYAHQLASGEA